MWKITFWLTQIDEESNQRIGKQNQKFYILLCQHVETVAMWAILSYAPIRNLI